MYWAVDMCFLIITPSLRDTGGLSILAMREGLKFKVSDLPKTTTNLGYPSPTKKDLWLPGSHPVSTAGFQVRTLLQFKSSQAPSSDYVALSTNFKKIIN